MKLVSLKIDGQSTYGWVDGDEVCIPESGFLARYPGIAAVIGGNAFGQLADSAVARRVPLAAAEFEPVIPRPGKLMCVGINYLPHIKEMGREPPPTPVLFVRFPDSQVGHGQPLVRPAASEQYDFEGELALVIGKTARHVKAADALDYVAGYSCFMDGSVRDWQNHGSQFTPGKNFHASGSFGPWLVTSDEIPDPKILNLQTRLNGEVMQSACVGDLKFDIPYLIEYCSTFAQLEPGDVISTGTPGGVGYARKPQLWLKPGDTLEVEVDGIGILSNPIVAE